jgi:hypothetical protein
MASPFKRARACRSAAAPRQEGRFDIRAARQELADIIDWKSPDSSSAESSTSEYAISKEQEERVLQLLRAYNTLAAELFSDCRPLKNKYPPLAFLVEKDATVASVREVYEMFPTAIHYRDRWGNSPLHFACMARANVKVMAFLLEKSSPNNIVSLANRVGYTPLHFLMSGRSGRELTCEALDAILVPLLTSNNTLLMTNDLGLTPLDLALKSNIGAKALEHLFQAASQWGGISSFQVPHRTDDGRFGLKHARALANLLPTLTTFTYTQCCHGKMWTEKAFCHLVQAIGQSKSLENVILEVPRRILMTDPKAPYALQEMISNTHTRLRELTLHCSNEEGRSSSEKEEDCDDEWMSVLVRGFEVNRTVESLVLYGVVLQNPAALRSLWSGLWQPKTLHLLGFGVPCWADDEPDAASTECRCESMRLEGPNWDFGLLRQLGSMAQLVRLRIAYTGNTDLAVPLASLLVHSPSLKDLEVSAGCCVKNHDVIIRALQTNFTLEKYRYASGMDREIRARIEYYTNLNKYGRARASNPNCSIEEFVHLLCLASVELTTYRRQMDVLNIHFGLLSLDPSLWLAAQT